MPHQQKRIDLKALCIGITRASAGAALANLKNRRPGPARTYWFCENCGDSIPDADMRFNAAYRIVCPRCYLADVPAEDIEAALYEAGEDARLDALAAALIRYMERRGEV